MAASVAQGQSCGTGTELWHRGCGLQKALGMAITLYRQPACLHMNGAEEMWQEKTKQKVCHMTCNNKYLVV